MLSALSRFSLCAPAVEAQLRNVSNASIEFFRSVLGDKSVVTDALALAPHNQDWTTQFQGSSTVMLTPSTTEQISRIMAHCSSKCIPVVPQGGNTGLVGGGVPLDGELILSMSKLNRIMDFLPEGVLLCEAGCVLETLDQHAQQRGHRVPLDLGAKGSCQIGGNLASNAGGLRFLHYGSLRASVLGLEAVLADGRVLDCLKTLRKDNTGYDLKQLLIGSEGTLGVITKVAIQCVPSPAHVATWLLALKDFGDVVKTLKLAKKHLGPTLMAFEFIDQASMEVALDHVPGVKNPFQQNIHPMYVLMEQTGASEEKVTEEFMNFWLEAGEKRGLIVDSVGAEDSIKVQNLWRIREGISESLQSHGTVYKYDLSMPLVDMYSLVEQVRAKLAHFGSRLLVAGYGHVADGNLHLNIADASRADDFAIRDVLEPFVYQWTADRHGSVSAEHGIGVLKKKYLPLSQPPLAVELMQQLKVVFDPLGILNPGKVLGKLTHTTRDGDYRVLHKFEED